MQTIKFNKDIYKLPCLKAAITEFADIAKFRLSENGKYLQVQIDKIKPGYSNFLADEFSNYVLGLHS